MIIRALFLSFSNYFFRIKKSHFIGFVANLFSEGN